MQKENKTFELRQLLEVFADAAAPGRQLRVSVDEKQAAVTQGTTNS
jgi:hypothetical protein